jgi:hypothetical protein
MVTGYIYNTIYNSADCHTIFEVVKASSLEVIEEWYSENWDTDSTGLAFSDSGLMITSLTEYTYLNK